MFSLKGTTNGKEHKATSIHHITGTGEGNNPKFDLTQFMKIISPGFLCGWLQV